jgi:BioD-like phosphotransacetylase family protein
MAKKIFIAATGQHCGKTTLSVSLMHLARRCYERVGFIKPLGPKVATYGDRVMDMDAILMARTFGLEEEMEFMSPVSMEKNFTRDFLEGKMTTAGLEARIARCREHLEARYDFLIIEGAGHGGVGSVIGLNNARIAKLFDAPVLLVTDGGIGSAIDAVHLNLALYRQEGADVRALMINKLIAEKRERVLEYLRMGFLRDNLQVLGGFNYSAILANPTLGHVADLFGLPLKGDGAKRSRIIHHIQLGAASSQRVVDALLESTLVIVTGSRDELIVTLSSLYHIPSYNNRIAGLVITGHNPVSEISRQILDDSAIPYIRIEETTSDVFTTLQQDVAKITVEDQEKLQWIMNNAGHDIDFNSLNALL